MNLDATLALVYIVGAPTLIVLALFNRADSRARKFGLQSGAANRFKENR